MSSNAWIQLIRENLATAEEDIREALIAFDREDYVTAAKLLHGKKTLLGRITNRVKMLAGRKDYH